MIVLDTTVLAYSVGHEHAYRASCRALIAAIATGRLHATTTPEVVQEFCHVHARRRPRVDAVARARHFVDLLSPLRLVGESELGRGLTMFESTLALGGFDAVLAAAAMAVDATLVSADRAFGDVPGLRHVVPDQAGVAALLP